MNSRRQVAVALVVVLATATPVGFGLADPLDSRPAPPTVDTSAPPERVAFDVLTAVRRGDYEATWLVDEAAGLPQRGSMYEFVRVEVEYSDREMLQYAGGSSQVVYLDENCHWTANRTTGERTRWECGRGLPRGVLVDDPTPVLDPAANVTVVRENESVMVLRINDTATALTVLSRETVDELEVRRANLSAYGVLVVDKEAGRLERVVLVSLPRVDDGYRTDGSQTVYRFTDWRTTEVRRPHWAKQSLVEFLVDVTDFAEDR